MQPMKKILSVLAVVGLTSAAADAAIYTFNDFTRTANGPNTDLAYDFVPNEGWSGSPPNAISGEDSLYLAFTVSWEAASNIGVFDVQFNRNDNGGAGRWSVRTKGAGFAFFTGNANSDPDGAGPATAEPTVDAVDTTAVTSVTLVLKVDQIQAGISPGGDYWYANPAQQDNAAGFLYIDPDLSASEAGQTTKWAAWRSSNTSYQGVSFTTDTAGVDLVFTDIALYTGDDTPFGQTPVVPEPASLAMGLVGLSLMAARRRVK